jgi:hypothetical protein
MAYLIRTAKRGDNKTLIDPDSLSFLHQNPVGKNWGMLIRLE